MGGRPWFDYISGFWTITYTPTSLDPSGIYGELLTVMPFGDLVFDFVRRPLRSVKPCNLSSERQLLRQDRPASEEQNRTQANASNQLLATGKLEWERPKLKTGSSFRTGIAKPTVGGSVSRPDEYTSRAAEVSHGNRAEWTIADANSNAENVGCQLRVPLCP